MLLDKFVPMYQFNEIHTIAIDASPENIYRAVKQVRPSEITLFKQLMGIRTLPAILMRRRMPTRRKERPIIDDALGANFTLLAEAPNREFVMGLIGKFWQISGGQVKLQDAQSFLDFAEPEYGKTAFNFYIYTSKQSGETRLRTETRIYVGDEAARRKFSRYWLVISLGSRFLRLMWLRAIKRKAEAFDAL